MLPAFVLIASTVVTLVLSSCNSVGHEDEYFYEGQAVIGKVYKSGSDSNRYLLSSNGECWGCGLDTTESHNPYLNVGGITLGETKYK